MADLWRDVIGPGVKRAREQAKLRQEDAAKRFRFYGLTTWRRGTIAQVEAGIRRPSFAELILVALALDIAVQDLVLDGVPGYIDVNGTKVTPEALRALMADRDRFDALPVDAFHAAGWTPEHVDALNRAGDAWSAEVDRLIGIAKRFGIESYTLGLLKGALEDVVEDAERYAGRRLHVDVPTLRLAAHALWGRRLPEERDAHLDNETVGTAFQSARRRQIAQGLISDLEAFLREHSQSDDQPAATDQSTT